jgi:hypothetical protein
MSFRTIGANITLAVIGCLWCEQGIAVRPTLKSSVEAKQDLTLPQNFRVSELREGPGRFQVSLVYEWDRAMKKGTAEPYREYQLNKACTYKFSGGDKLLANPSGMTVMSGPGPKYRVDAVCNCAPPAYLYIGPAVKVYQAAVWVYMADPPGATAPKNPVAFIAPCKRTK